MVIYAVYILLAIPYVHPRLAAIKKGWARFGSFWLLISAIFFLIVGLIPPSISPIRRLHEDSAAIGAVGVLLAAACYGIILIKASKDQVNKKINLFLAIIMWGFLIYVGISYLGSQLLYQGHTFMVHGVPTVLGYFTFHMGCGRRFSLLFYGSLGTGWLCVNFNLSLVFGSGYFGKNNF